LNEPGPISETTGQSIAGAPAASSPPRAPAPFVDDPAQTARGLVAEIKNRLGRISQRELEVERRESELERQYAFLEAYAKEIEERVTGAASRRPADDQSTHLEVRNREVAQQQVRLERLRAEVAARELELTQRQTELERRRDELETRRTDVDSRDAALTATQSELTARHGELLARQTELLVRQSEIEERQASVQRLYDEAASVEARVREGQAEAAALREQLDAREAQLSHSTLQVEVERDRLDAERARVEAEREELARLRAEAEQQKAAQVRVVAPTIRRRQRPWVWLIPPLVAGIAYLAARQASLQSDLPRYRATASLDVQSPRVAAHAAIAEHLRELGDPKLIEGRLDNPAVAIAYRAARNDGRVLIESNSEHPAIDISVVAADPRQAATIATAMANAYSAYAAQLAPDRLAQPALEDWTHRRSAVEAELAEARSMHKESAERARQSAGFDAWDKANEAFESAQTDFYTLSDRLGEERGKLAARRAQDSPRGEVTDEDLAAAVDSDVVLREDRLEFDSIAQQYQLELAVAMLPMLEPVGELRDGVRTLLAAAVEQRDLQPPQSVRAVLEQAVADLESFDAATATFNNNWTMLKLGLERLRPAAQADELMHANSEIAEAARVFAGAARDIVARMNQRVEEIAGKGDAGARAQVILSMLRGNLSNVADKSKAVVAAAASTDQEVNIKLDALDRKLRGVRGRIEDRTQLLKRSLQESADQNAKGERSRAITESEIKVRELERKREDLSEQLKQRLTTLRSLQGKTQDARVLLADVAVKERAVQRIEERLKELDVQRPAPTVDVVRAAEPVLTQLAGQGRETRANQAGAVASGIGLVLSLALLLFGRFSRTLVIEQPPQATEPN
jgi:hypothetical protein